MAYEHVKYQFFEGEEINGIDAVICSMLDKREPIEHELAMNDTETLAELKEVWPSMWWCPELRATIVQGDYDTYKQVKGTDVVSERVINLNDMRLKWARSMLARAAGADPAYTKRAVKYINYIQTCGNNNRVSGVVNLFCQTSTIETSRLDREPSLLGTPHGALDLDSGSLCFDDDNDPRRFRITQSTNAYIPSTFADDVHYDFRWDEFVLEIMEGDEEKAKYLQRALGYSILGGNREECMFIAYGPSTRNGKNTLLDSVQWALGEYAATAESDFLLAGSKMGGANEALASLVGKRIVFISEPPKERKLNESKVKSLVSCDRQSTSKKYGAQFEFEPQFTMWMSCNHLPRVEDDSVFASDRIRVIPFNKHFGEDERDTTLKSRFRTPVGACTVLRWLMEGYWAYKKQGLKEPESIKEATKNYVSSGGSTVSKFIRACCKLNNEARVENNMFQGAYQDYCKNILDEPHLSANALKEELKEWGITKKSSHSQWYWLGVELDVEFDLAGASSSTEGAKKKNPKGKGRVKIS